LAEIERGEFVTLEDLLPASLSSRQRLSMPLPVKIGVLAGVNYPDRLTTTILAGALTHQNCYPVLTCCLT
jgi:hypothetical protein